MSLDENPRLSLMFLLGLLIAMIVNGIISLLRPPPDPLVAFTLTVICIGFPTVIGLLLIMAYLDYYFKERTKTEAKQ